MPLPTAPTRIASPPASSALRTPDYSATVSSSPTVTPTSTLLASATPQAEWTKPLRPISSNPPVPSPRRSPARKSTRRVVVTPSDVETLAFLGRYSYATYGQLARLTGRSPDALRQRFPRLQRQGLMHRLDVYGRQGVWVPTSGGVALSGLNLPTPRVSYPRVLHTLGLVELGIFYEQRREQVVTEREIRAADALGPVTARMEEAFVSNGYPIASAHKGLYCVKTPTGRHIPDLVLVRPATPAGTGNSVAVELELTRKRVQQYKAILKAYREAAHIGHVVYVTPYKSVAQAVTAAAQSLSLDWMVEVQVFNPADPTVRDLLGFKASRRV